MAILTIFLNGEKKLGVDHWNGNFRSKTNLSHQKVIILAIKIMYFFLKTQLKFTKFAKLELKNANLKVLLHIVGLDGAFLVLYE